MCAGRRFFPLLAARKAGFVRLCYVPSPHRAFVFRVARAGRRGVSICVNVCVNMRGGVPMGGQEGGGWWGGGCANEGRWVCQRGAVGVP